LQFILAVDDPHVDLEAVFVLKQFLDAVVELQKGTDENQPILGGFDEFFEKVIGGAGIQELRHECFSLCFWFLSGTDYWKSVLQLNQPRQGIVKPKCHTTARKMSCLRIETASCTRK
jgi:hypothetical protein